MPTTQKVRQSAEVPGLTYELRPSADGTVYVVFRLGAAFDAYTVAPGRAEWADCSDRASMPAKVFDYCRTFAATLADKLAAQAVAA